MTATESVGPKVIKRYDNRKLYDTETSKYTTLREIAAVVAGGREVRVVQNKTNADITGQTLVMALVETENGIFDQAETLHSILKAGGIAKYVAGLKTNQHQFLP